MESTQTLTFKLVIDGKESFATLDLTKSEFVEIEQQISKLAGTRAPMLQQFAKDLSTVDLASEEAAASILEFIQVNQLTENEIQSVINILKQQQNVLAVGSKEWQQHGMAIQKLNGATLTAMGNQAGLNAGMKAGIPGTQQMNMAMMQFGYTLNDAQMFMVNARMGLMGISNNIPMIVQNFIQAKAAAGGSATAMQLITRSIMGGGGLIIGINALLLVMNMLPALFDKTTKAAEDQKEAIKKLKDEYEKLTREQLNNYIQTRNEELSQLQSKHPGERTGSFSSGTIVGGLGPGNIPRDKYAVSGEARYGDDYARVQKLEEELQVLKETARDLGVIENVRNRITINQANLNKLNEDEASPFYYKNIVKTANSYAEARKELEGWIAADEKIVKTKEQKNKEDDKEFKAATDKLETAQTHAIKMAEIEGKSDKDILEMKKQQLAEQIKLYEKYGKDVTGLLFELAETEAELQIGRKVGSSASGGGTGAGKAGIPNEDEREKFLNQFQDDKLKELDIEEAVNLRRAEMFGATEEQKLAISKYYARQREEIEQQALFTTLSQASNMLGQLAGMFGEHTEAYKTLAIAQVWIETYKGVAALYAPPPVGVGPVLAPFFTAAVLGMGALQTANIMKQDTGIKGFATGGKLPKGKMGFFEGTHDEVVAPEKDFKTYSAELVKAALMDARNYISINQSSMTDLGEVKGLLTRLNKHLDEGIKARAYLDDRQAKKIRNRGSALNRRSKS